MVSLVSRRDRFADAVGQERGERALLDVLRRRYPNVVFEIRDGVVGSDDHAARDDRPAESREHQAAFGVAWLSSSSFRTRAGRLLRRA